MSSKPNPQDLLGSLIDVAKTSPDPNLRKRAMQQLGQSTAPRALDFFAQVLKP